MVALEKMKKCPEICAFQDLVDLCEKSRAKVKPIIMQYHDFYEFEKCHCNRKSNDVAPPRLNSISVVKFRKGSCAMWIKHAFEGDYQKVNFLKTKFRLNITPRTNTVVNQGEFLV